MLRVEPCNSPIWLTLTTLCRENELPSSVAQKEEAVLAACQMCPAGPHPSCTPVSPDPLLGFCSPSKLALTSLSLATFCLVFPCSSLRSLLHDWSIVAALAPLSR